MFKPLNEKGQVAIFIALIFQVLFLFFAMIINVGLLVHHKINLQNSVDLAAYYGASKQAEMLNAIGHINYQIRQSWKLLAWRYRQLGTAGNFSAAHPYRKAPPGLCPPGWCPQGDTEGVPNNSAYQPFYDAPPFCITYSPFEPMPPSENTCKNVQDGYTIPLFKPAPIVAGSAFVGAAIAVNKLTTELLHMAGQRCRYIGPWNYVTLARFVTAFAMDQAERKLLMRHLALGLSESETDFWDVNGDSVRDGIQNTLTKNLSQPNQDGNLEFEVYNSLASPGCGPSPGTYDPPKWLSEIKVFPSFVYVDTNCGAGGALTQQIIVVNNPLDVTPYHTTANPQLEPLINHFKNYVGGTAPAPYNFSLGYEKNPWCMAYVGVKAKATPKIPFAPLGGVTLHAKAFAKPFGGRIGPWYGKTWSPGQYESDKTEKIDSLLPPRAADASSLGNWNDPTRVANHSKYPGDIYGQKSMLPMGHYGKAIFETKDHGDAPDFDHWKHLGEDFKTGKHGDILAWDEKHQQNNQIRKLEISAIAPDLFDITYYSIEPDFFNVYFKKIRDGFLPRKGGFPYLPRGDIGSRMDHKDLESFSVKDQLAVVKEFANKGAQILDVEGKLTYIAYNSQGATINKSAPLLTSWVGKNLVDYSLDPDVFAKCNTEPPKDMPTSGNCVGPGRSGYSVKIISQSYLESNEHAIGGNSTKDKIMNPPPTNF